MKRDQRRVCIDFVALAWRVTEYAPSIPGGILAMRKCETGAEAHRTARRWRERIRRERLIEAKAEGQSS